jgi:hypothetical protein
MITQEYLLNTYTYENGKLFRKSNGKEVICSKSKWHRYLRIGINGKAEALHRVIFLYHHGYMPKITDHIDGDRYNNKIENLREATQQQNCLNKKHYKNSSSPFKNVHWHSDMKKWRVCMNINGIRKIFGYFDNIELADLVAQEARTKYHGEFARNY